MSAVINVEQKEENKVKKAFNKAYEYRYVILAGATAGALYFLGFKHGWRGCSRRDAGLLKEAFPKLMDKYGKLGAYAMYDWMCDYTPDAAKMCDAFVENNPGAKAVSDYFYKEVGPMIEEIQNFKV